MSITLLGTEGYDEHLYVNAVERLAAAGYSGEFELLGIGMTGVVVLDGIGQALKIARHGGSDIDSIGDEFDFLQTMADSPVAHHLSRPISWDAAFGIMTREAVEGRAGGWGTRGLRDAYDSIVKEARARDWSHPEFKENSFIIRDDGSIVMVDVGFANRLGYRFIAWMHEKFAQGFVPTATDVENFSFNLRMDASNGLIPQEVADEEQAKLRAMPIRVGRSFGALKERPETKLTAWPFRRDTHEIVADDTGRDVSGDDLPVEVIPMNRVNISQRSVVERNVVARSQGGATRHEPILVDAEPDGTFTVVDGHHRLEAARRRGERAIQAFVIRTK